MNRYFVSELYPHALFTAGALREDIETVLEQTGYKKLFGSLSNNIFGRITAYMTAGLLINKLEKPGLIFFHFPLRSKVITRLSLPFLANWFMTSIMWVALLCNRKTELPRSRRHLGYVASVMASCLFREI